MNIEIMPTKQKELPYQFFLEVEDERYLSQAYELSNLFVDCSNDNHTIDFELVKKQIQAESGLAIIATQSVDLNKKYQALSMLTSDIAGQLTAQDSFGIFDKQRLQTIVAHAFCDLDKQKDQPWFYFSEEDMNHTKHTHYQYNFLIVSQSDRTGPLMALSLLSIQVDVENSTSSIFGQPSKPDALTLDSDKINIKLKGLQAVKQLS
ncbi:hypothetical protein GCM10007938_23250 [Vibrio zhanjiangensis]|uniref:Type-2Aa cytolytic delta-endotoxin n=1 Tax=Vibrio zhanjiangensis TaxID=1046128 RepID=A0ABQ6EZW4_9VIBR|nr:hypothetical protein [Vibrio zhanjiangensis]GLT18546.1 hypothetical protein GCM10007938_23250 [Vibrio zhanjiangensis]